MLSAISKKKEEMNFAMKRKENDFQNLLNKEKAKFDAAARNF